MQRLHDDAPNQTWAQVVDRLFTTIVANCNFRCSAFAASTCHNFWQKHLKLTSFLSNGQQKTVANSETCYAIRPGCWKLPILIHEQFQLHKQATHCTNLATQCCHSPINCEVQAGLHILLPSPDESESFGLISQDFVNTQANSSKGGICLSFSRASPTRVMAPSIYGFFQ